jgi:GT2 family glycosyltransferase
MLVSRRFVEIAGPMREDYFLYAEEVEWCLRGLARGLRLGFAQEALVLHKQGSSTGSADPIRRRPRLPVHLDHRNAVLLIRDTRPERLLVAAIANAVAALVRYGRRGGWRQVGYAWSGVWDGLRDRRGKPAWFSS